MVRLRTSLAATGVALMVLAAGAAALPVPCQAQAVDAGRSAATPAPLRAPTPTADLPVVPAGTASAVVSAVRRVSPRADVGLLVWDQVSGRRLVETGAATRFQSASLVKLLVAVAAERAGIGGERITRMLRASDDATASALWGLLGGDSLPGEVAASLGIGGVVGPDIPGRWGNVRLSADDVTTVYRHLLDERPALIRPLVDAPRRAADGFDQHFGIPSAFPGPWAVKQAWGTSARATTAHTTGVLANRYVVVLLTSHPRGTGFTTATAAATAGAKALAQAMPD